MTTQASIATAEGRAHRPAALAREAVMVASFSASAGIVAKFATIAGGVWIEQTETPLGTTRAWRFDDRGNAEWACLAALQAGGARWFGHQFTAKDFVLC